MSRIEQSQVIIRRPRKVVGGAHHGGAWKVAYADFVTAMWAFFMLLWLLSSVTEEQLQGISNYFAPTMASQSRSGAGGMLGGTVIGEGAQTSTASSPTLVQHLPPSSVGPGGEDMTTPMEEPAEGLSERELMERLSEREQQRFERVKVVIEQTVHGIPELKRFEGSLLVDNTPDGLRIQITDQDGLAMFPAGSSAMYGHTRAMLDLVAKVVNQLPNRITVSGHTDATPFQDPSGYGNWELSADRALAARRGLVASGVPEGKIYRVIGQGDQEPLDEANPNGSRNRRLSIVLLRQNSAPVSPPH